MEVKNIVLEYAVNKQYVFSSLSTITTGAQLKLIIKERLNFTAYKFVLNNNMVADHESLASKNIMDSDHITAINQTAGGGQSDHNEEILYSNYNKKIEPLITSTTRDYDGNQSPKSNICITYTGTITNRKQLVNGSLEFTIVTVDNVSNTLILDNDLGLLYQLQIIGLSIPEGINTIERFREMQNTILSSKRVTATLMSGKLREVVNSN